jgi:hypothetical protein
VFLGFEERQPLVNEDIPLPFGLPAVEQRLAQRRVSLSQAADDRFGAAGIRRQANRGNLLAAHLSPSGCVRQWLKWGEVV